MVLRVETTFNWLRWNKESPAGSRWNRSCRKRGKIHDSWANDMGIPSVCGEYVLLPLVNKEVALVYDRADYKRARIYIYIHTHTHLQNS